MIRYHAVSTSASYVNTKTTTQTIAYANARASTVSLRRNNMPVFDIRCKNKLCQLVVEDQLLMHDYEIRDCPICGQEMERLTGAANFRIRGFSEANGYSHDVQNV
jgi:predicted nucleic acid-binding Zn ribbon protein